MADQNRAEKLLNKWVGERVCTPEGKDWFVAATDAFHDTQLKSLQGFPDVNVQPSVVRCIKQTMTIKRDPSIPLGNWDLSIVGYPDLKVGNNIKYSREGNHFGGALSLATPMGGLMTYQAVSGANVGPTTSPAGVFLEIPQEYTKGSWRFIGGGFETVNTTALLVRQGQVFTWRQNMNPIDPTAFEFSDPPLSSTMYGISTPTLQRLPPKNVAEVMLLPGTRQWSADEGSYSMQVINNMENPPFAADYNAVAYVDGDDDVVGDYATTPIWHPIMVPSSGTPPPFPGTAKFASQHTSPIAMSGVFYSGLSESSAISVTWNIYIESFPAVSEKEILVLATPSAQYDPAILEIYSHAMSLLPTGVPVADNEEGSWFWDVVGKVGKFVGPLLMKSGNPLAMAAGTVVEGITSSMDSFSQPPNNKARNAKKPVARQVQQKIAPALAAPPAGARAPKKRANKKKKVQQDEAGAKIAEAVYNVYGKKRGNAVMGAAGF